MTPEVRRIALRIREAIAVLRLRGEDVARVRVGRLRWSVLALRGARLDGVTGIGARQAAGLLAPVRGFLRNWAFRKGEPVPVAELVVVEAGAASGD